MSQTHQQNHMDRIKAVEEILRGFSFYKSPLSVIKVDRKKGKAGRPFPVQADAGQ